jgi:hypothetical protein
MIGSLLIFIKAFFFDDDALSFSGIRQLMNFRKKSVNADGEIKKRYAWSRQTSDVLCSNPLFVVPDFQMV